VTDGLARSVGDSVAKTIILVIVGSCSWFLTAINDASGGWTVAGFLTAVFCYVYRPSRQREQQSIRATIRTATGAGSCVTALTIRQLLNVERYAL